MLRKLLLFFVIATISFNQDDNSKKQEHSLTCPESCEVCKEVVDKALKFAVEKQEKEGYWNAKLDGSPDGIWQLTDVAVTALYGLALYGTGSTTKDGKYQKEISSLRDWLVKKITDGTPKPKKDIFMQGYNSHRMHGYMISSWFLCHVYQTEQSKEIKELLEKLRDEFIKSQEKDGGWNYKTKRGRRSGMAYLTCIAATTFALLKEIGIKVEDKVLTRTGDFFVTNQNKDGGYPYFKTETREKRRVSEAGRTAESLWSMHLLAMQKTETYQNSKKHVEENYKKTAHSQHGPSFHLFFAALSTQSTGKELWTKFWQNFRDQIIKGQNEDGSIAMKPPDDAVLPIDEAKMGSCGGRIYATPLYLLMFQVSGKNLLFNKLMEK